MSPSKGFCIQCGSKLPTNAQFCNECGAAVASVAPTEMAQAQPGSPTYVAPQPAAQERHQEPQIYARQARPAPQGEPIRYNPSSANKTNRILPILAILSGGLICLVTGALLTFALVGYLADRKGTPTPLVQAATATHTQPPINPTATPIPPTTAPEVTLTLTIAPTEPVPTESEPTKPPGQQASYGNTTFYYQPEVAQNVNGQTVPESNYADAPYFDLYPEHSRFDFVGYPLVPDAFHIPQLMVYPAAQYGSINPEAYNTIIRLQNLLQSRPTDPPQEGLPFLPIWNAAQMMRAKIHYIDFQDGSGVRYLSQYGQSYWPINSQDMFYTFQGLTSNGAYYISAIFPVSNPILPDPNTVTMDEAFYNNYENYVREVENQLNNQPDNSFTPNLSLLDSLIQSLLIQ